MKNVKYMAGFLDAEGAYGISSFKNVDGTYTVYPYVSVGQATYQDQPLKMLAKEFDIKGSYKTFPDKNWSDTYNLHIGGKKGLRLMEQVKNHSVVKRDVIEWCLGQAGKRVSKEELKTLKRELKEVRKQPTTKKKPRPSRQWLAGFFDGDGCITNSLHKDGTLVTFITISCWKYDADSVELILKYFGGSIQESGDTLRYRLNITLNNCEKVVGFFAKHTISKKEQLYSVLDYVGNGLYLKRRGATTKQNKEFKENLAAMKRGRID